VPCTLTVEGMDNQAEVREFLVSRRAKLGPEQAGVPVHGTRRRVPGLRREEVAQLAGLSTDYYTRLEKGNLRSASEGVLDAISRALQLDEAERAHLHDLARTARDGARPVRRRTPVKQVRASLQHLLDAMTGAAATVVNGRLDVLASNALARGLQTDVFDTGGQPQNLARYCFLDPRSHDFYDSWTAVADATAAMLRTEAGRDPHDRALTELVGELATRSEEFRTRWARHDVRLHQQGTKRFHHALVGDITLHYNTVPLPADAGLSLTAYTAEPGSPSADKLRLLASWAASPVTSNRAGSVGEADHHHG
jgi:transcriptional regulator with XRE-family HTH domain